MRTWILLVIVLASFCVPAIAEAGCGRGARAARAVGGKAVKALRFVGRILPPYRR